MTDLAALDQQLDTLLANPLERFRASDVQRRMVELVLAGNETALMGGNQTGKTQIGAALVDSLAEGRGQLGGIVLPRLRQPTVWWVLTQTYKQQVESTQQAILRWLGDWPHKVRYAPGNPEAAQLILVKPQGGKDDHRYWSRIWFHVQATGESLPGGRVDGVWADEPPNIRCWEEATARGRGPGHPFLLWMTYTPIKRAEWEPLKLRYEGCDDVPVQRRVRIRAAAPDNPWLTTEYIDDLKDKWRGQWDYDARMSGAEVDDTGQCPFTSSAQLKDAMTRWQQRVRKPRIVEYDLRAESGAAWYPLKASVEWYHDPKDMPEESYIGFVDPSLGIADATHDPGGLHVYSRMRPRLVARFHSYLEPYALGQLAGKVMQQCGNDHLDIERNDNLILQVMRGARDVGFSNFTVEHREDKISGEIVESAFGWVTTSANRGGMIAAVQQLMLEDGVEIGSAGLLDGLRGVTVQPGGRIAAKGRKHDEDMILLGRFGLVARGMGPPMTRLRSPDPVREQIQRLLGVRPARNGVVSEPDALRE